MSVQRWSLCYTLSDGKHSNNICGITFRPTGTGMQWAVRIRSCCLLFVCSLYNRSMNSNSTWCCRFHGFPAGVQRQTWHRKTQLGKQKRHRNNQTTIWQNSSQEYSRKWRYRTLFFWKKTSGPFLPRGLFLLFFMMSPLTLCSPRGQFFPKKNVNPRGRWQKMLRYTWESVYILPNVALL